MYKKILLFLILISAPLVLATSSCRIPFQASGFKYANNTLIPVASVSTYVYVDPTGGIPVYSETWATGLQDGYVSVTMGNNTFGNPLNLNWGQTYWLAVSIDGVPVEMIDSYGVSSFRQAFTSTQGEIVQLTEVNDSVVAQSVRIDTLNITIAYINGTLIPNLITSNSSINTRVDTLNTTIQNLLTSNTSIWSWFSDAYLNITNLQTSNNSIWSWINNAYTNITNLQSSNTSTNLRITQLNVSVLNISMGAFYSKTVTTYTGSLTSGSLVGYQAGDAICNITYPGTHFCTQEEVMETIRRTNVSTMAAWTGDAWVSSGAPKYAPAPTPVNDCNGWTSAVASSYLGNYWHFSATGGGYGATINCGTSVALACCGVG